MNAKLIASAVVVFLAAGCAVGAGRIVDASVGTDFSLRPGETARAPAEEIEISFLAVTSDSRCGKGDTCVWAGDAELQISVRIRGKNFGEYMLHTNERRGSVASFDTFHVRLLSLAPPAIAGKAIKPDEYVANLRIARGTGGNDAVF